MSERGAAVFLAHCRAEYVNVASAAHMVAGDSNDLFASTVVDLLARTP